MCGSEQARAEVPGSSGSIATPGPSGAVFLPRWVWAARTVRSARPIRWGPPRRRYGQSWTSRRSDSARAGTRKSQTIMSVDHGGNGSESAPMAGALLPPVIIVLLARVISRALLVGTAQRFPQPGGPSWAPPATDLVDPREVRRVRAEVDAEWTSYCMDPYRYSSDRCSTTSPIRPRHGSSRAVNGWSSWLRWPKPQRRAWIATSSTSERCSIWPTRGTQLTSMSGRSGTGRMDPDTKRALSRARQLI